MSKNVFYDKIFDDEGKKNIINDYVVNGLSLREIYLKYNIKSKQWVGKLLDGNTRTSSDAAKLSHKKYPNSFKLSEEAKDKIRVARLKWMKEHPEQTAWRLRNISYPEECFKKMLEDNGLDKKYLIYREYSVFPYFIDFAFINEKVAVEIDGSQHLEEDRKKRDDEKDALLISNGWRVVRIAANEIVRGGENVLNSLVEVLGDNNVEYTKVGILKAPKSREKVVRGEDGLSDGERLRAFNQRKVDRPSKEKLNELIRSMSFVTIAKEYGVSDKAIVKWCKYYGLPHRKKDIN